MFYSLPMAPTLVTNMNVISNGTERMRYPRELHMAPTIWRPQPRNVPAEVD